jgi:hypothetical protein
MIIVKNNQTKINQEFMSPLDFWDHVDIALVRNRAQWTNGFAQDGVRINLGAGRKVIDGWHNVDYPDWDAEATDNDHWRLGFSDETVAEIACYFTLDHIEPWAVIRALQEFQRVLVRNGVATIVVPHYSSQLANECIMHKSRYGIDTWRNIFSERQYDHQADNGGEAFEWRLDVGANYLFGLTERNLCQVTQLVKKL